MTKMDKEYIEREYEQAIKEYNTALTEDDMDNARRTMKRLEAIAMQDTHFVIHLEVSSKRITKNLVCRFNFFIFRCYFRGYGILPMILGFGSIPTSSICRLSDK